MTHLIILLPREIQLWRQESMCSLRLLKARRINYIALLDSAEIVHNSVYIGFYVFVYFLTAKIIKEALLSADILSNHYYPCDL